MSAPAQTSDRVSSLAARYFNITPEQLAALMDHPAGPQKVAKDIHSMAASLVRQDQVKGPRKRKAARCSAWLE